jgi:hypothetical protein
MPDRVVRLPRLHRAVIEQRPDTGRNSPSPQQNHHQQQSSRETQNYDRLSSIGYRLMPEGVRAAYGIGLDGA